MTEPLQVRKCMAGFDAVAKPYQKECRNWGKINTRRNFVDTRRHSALRMLTKSTISSPPQRRSDLITEYLNRVRIFLEKTIDDIVNIIILQESNVRRVKKNVFCLE
jgi:hypothetical protein